jgi:hypothetical protein
MTDMNLYGFLEIHPFRQIPIEKQSQERYFSQHICGKIHRRQVFSLGLL